MSSKVKAKKAKDIHPEEDPALSIAVGKNVLRVGARVEALDYLGNWYTAKILRIRMQKKEVLVHFAGWQSKWDVWLPHNSERIRFPKEVKEKEWRVGERVVAKWGLDKKMYPGTVARILNENYLEIIFFDGIRKQFNKRSVKPDTEKLYRQFEDTRKQLMTASNKGPILATTGEPQTDVVEPTRPKRRLTEPSSMTDFVTGVHLKRQKKISDAATSGDDLMPSTAQLLPSDAASGSSAGMEVATLATRQKLPRKATLAMLLQPCAQGDLSSSNQGVASAQRESLLYKGGKETLPPPDAAEAGNQDVTARRRGRPQRKLSEKVSLSCTTAEDSLARRAVVTLAKRDTHLKQKKLSRPCSDELSSFNAAGNSATDHPAMTVLRRGKVHCPTSKENSLLPDSTAKIRLRRSVQDEVSASDRSVALKLDTGNFEAAISDDVEAASIAAERLHSVTVELTSPVTVEVPKLSITCISDSKANTDANALKVEGSGDAERDFVSRIHDTSPTQAYSSGSSGIMKIVKKVSDNSSVEIVKKKNKSYMIFPIMTAADQISSLRRGVKEEIAADSEAIDKITADVLECKAVTSTDVTSDSLKTMASKSAPKDRKATGIPGVSSPVELRGSKVKLKVKFPFGSKRAVSGVSLEKLEMASLGSPHSKDVDEKILEKPSEQHDHMVHLVREPEAPSCHDNTLHPAPASEQNMAAVFLGNGAPLSDGSFSIKEQEVSKCTDGEVKINREEGINTESHSLSKVIRSRRVSQRQSIESSMGGPNEDEVKGFEKRFELFKLKWKEEKAKRRRTLNSPSSSEGSSSSHNLQAQDKEFDFEGIPSLVASSENLSCKSNSAEVRLFQHEAAEGRPRRRSIPSAKLKSARESSGKAQVPSTYAPVNETPLVPLKKESKMRVGRLKGLSIEVKGEIVSETEVVSSTQYEDEPSLHSTAFSELSQSVDDVKNALPLGSGDKISETETLHDNLQGLPPVIAPSISTLSKVDMVDSPVVSEAPFPPKKRVGWPKGRPRRKVAEKEIVPPSEARSLGPGRPKRDPLGADTSRTPHYGETISFASMVPEERPSQRKRAAYADGSQGMESSMLNPCDVIVDPGIRVSEVSHATYECSQKLLIPTGDRLVTPALPPRSATTSSGPSVSQILASKIQRRVRQQRRQQNVSVEPPCTPPAKSSLLQEPGRSSGIGSLPPAVSTSDDDTQDSIIVVQPQELSSGSKSERPDRSHDHSLSDVAIGSKSSLITSADSKAEELDLTDIKLNEAKSSSRPGTFKRKKSLDFITGRLNQKRKTMFSVSDRVDRVSVCESSALAPMQHVTMSPTLLPTTSPVLTSRGPSRTYGTDGLVTDLRPVIDQYMSPPPPHYQLHPSFSGASLSNNGTVRISYPGSHRHQIFPPGYIPVRSRRPGPSGFAHGLPFLGGSGLLPHPHALEPFYPSFSGHAPSCNCMPCTQRKHGILTECQVYPPQYSSFRPPHGHGIAYRQHPPYALHPVLPPHVVLGQGLIRPMHADDFAENKFGATVPQPMLPIRPIGPVAPDHAIVKVSKLDASPEVGAVLVENDQVTTPEIKVESKGSGASVDSVPAKLMSHGRERRRRTRQEDSQHALRSRQISEKAGLAPKEFSVEVELSSYKCPYRMCGKSFRKSSLLDSHIQYFHTNKPTPKRNRSSGSLSSSESNPASNLTSPVLPPVADVSLPTDKTSSAEAAHSESKEVTEDLTTLRSGYTSAASDGESVTLTEDSSESESESESDLPSVDDRIKCLCESEDETGFMIQCEQCITWQHGECVGYAEQKDVPSFYLCNVCSNPKGLRRSTKYDNDYTWFKQGRLPAPSDPQTVNRAHQVIAAADQEAFENIMMASHTLMSELYNIYQVLQGVKAKLILVRNPGMLLKMWASCDKGDLRDRVKSDNSIPSGGSPAEPVHQAVVSSIGYTVTPLITVLGGRTIVTGEVEKGCVGAADSTLKRVDSAVQGTPVISENYENRDFASSHVRVKGDSDRSSFTEDSDLAVSAKNTACLTPCERESSDSTSVNSCLTKEATSSSLVGAVHQENRCASGTSYLKAVLEDLVPASDNAILPSDKPIIALSKQNSVTIVSTQLTCVCSDEIEKEVPSAASEQELLKQVLEVVDESSEAPSRELVKASSSSKLSCPAATIGPSDRDGSRSLSPAIQQSADGSNFSCAPPSNASTVAETSGDSSYTSSFDLRLEGIPEFPDLDTDECVDIESEDAQAAQASLLSEVEKLEEQVSDRLDEIEQQITVLEQEYDGLGKSDGVIKRVQSQFSLPDLSSLLRMVERLKWIGVVNEKRQHQVRQQRMHPVEPQAAMAV